jgi:hypothetical protein
MAVTTIDREASQIVLHTDGSTCATTLELVESRAFARVVHAYVAWLRAHHSPLLQRLGIAGIELPGTYFANIFGAAQRREQHEEIARAVFAAAFASGTFVGQLRTRLGLQGCEAEGPRAAAAALLAHIATRHAAGA